MMNWKSLIAAVWSVFVLVGCATGPDGGAGKRGEVTISPYEVGTDAEYPHYVAVRIRPPWPEEGEWVLRAPETLGSNKGLLFIDHHLETMIPVTRPMAPLDWKRQPNGALCYRAILDWDIEMDVCVVPEGDELTIEATLINDSFTDLADMGHQFCLVQSGIPAFHDRYAERTVYHTDGEFVRLSETEPGLGGGAEKPGFIITNMEQEPPWTPIEGSDSWVVQEQADLPLIATVSKENPERIVGLAFENAYKIMTNAGIPCIHADPKFPDAAQGETVQVRGKMYFIEGTLADLEQRFYEDFPEWDKNSR